jgi:hypothetical protein
MKKSDLVKHLLGESDVVPVLANVSPSVRFRRFLRGRNRNFRSVKDDEDDEDNEDMSGDDEMEKDDFDDSTVKSVIGENQEDDKIIPDDAEEIDVVKLTTQAYLKNKEKKSTKHCRPINNKCLTPHAALTAPDITPEATKPIDPSEIPGVKPFDKFKATDLAEPASKEKENSSASAKAAIDTLLGRRADKEEISGEEKPESIKHEAISLSGKSALIETQLAAMMTGIGSPDECKMPYPIVSDGKAILEAFHQIKGESKQQV